LVVRANRRVNVRIRRAHRCSITLAVVAGLVLLALLPGVSLASPPHGRYAWSLHCSATGTGPNSARGSWTWLNNGTVISRGGTPYTNCPGAHTGGGARPAHANGIRVTFGACAQAVCHLSSATKSFGFGAAFFLTVKLNQTVGNSTTIAKFVIRG
jgi:hypothetical protein